MSTIIIETKNESLAKALIDFLKVFDYKVKVQNIVKRKKKEKEELPLIPAKENADFMQLAGIWEGKEITLQELRKKAWGDRL